MVYPMHRERGSKIEIRTCTFWLCWLTGKGGLEPNTMGGGGDKSVALFQSSLYERNIYAPPEHKLILLDYHQRKVCFRAYIMQSVRAFTN
jgi:hypothetical protein